jgi:hypothetical protein
MNTNTLPPSTPTAYLRTGLLLLLVLVATATVGLQNAHAAQWKWTDAQGKIQYSDRPPPPDVTDKQILQRPKGGNTAAAKPTSAEPLAALATQKPSAPSTDPALEKKKQAQAAEEEAKRKAEEEKRAQIRASNCDKARKYDKALSQGYRVSRVNEKGEREFLDEKGLAEEAANTRRVMSSNCQ